VLDYSKRFLFYGFAISLLLHAIFGPFVEWKPQITETPEPLSSITISTAAPKPPPIPTQTPTPHAHLPLPQTPAPHRAEAQHAHPPKTIAENANVESEKGNDVVSGLPGGIPDGNGDSGPPAATLAPMPTPTPTKPACATPNAPATATQKVTPDMPEVARQMGASGTAQIEVSLDARGNVIAASVYTSTNNSALDKAALQAAQQSKYSPEIVNCAKSAGSYIYTVTFESR
jgi:TonB family protein